jgi:hypothetical protein
MAAVLNWNANVAVDGRSPAYHEHEAKTAAADYRVTPALKTKAPHVRAEL